MGAICAPQRAAQALPALQCRTTLQLTRSAMQAGRFYMGSSLTEAEIERGWSVRPLQPNVGLPDAEPRPSAAAPQPHELLARRIPDEKHRQFVAVRERDPLCRLGLQAGEGRAVLRR